MIFILFLFVLRLSYLVPESTLSGVIIATLTVWLMLLVIFRNYLAKIKRMLEELGCRPRYCFNIILMLPFLKFNYLDRDTCFLLGLFRPQLNLKLKNPKEPLCWRGLVTDAGSLTVLPNSNSGFKYIILGKSLEVQAEGFSLAIEDLMDELVAASTVADYWDREEYQKFGMIYNDVYLAMAILWAICFGIFYNYSLNK